MTYSPTPTRVSTQGRRPDDGHNLQCRVWNPDEGLVARQEVDYVGGGGDDGRTSKHQGPWAT